MSNLHKPTLKEVLAEKARLKELSSSPVVASLSENSERTENALNELKNKINTNILVSNEHAPKTLKPTLQEILNGKKASLPIKPSEAVHIPATNTSTFTKTDLASAIANASKQITLKERLAIMAHTQKQVAQELNIKTVEEAKEFISKPTAREAGNLPDNVGQSLKDRLAGLVKKHVPELAVPVEEAVKETVRQNETFSLNITLNERQQAAVNFADSGKSFVLLGAAGTGKTSSEGAMLHRILDSNTISTTQFKGGRDVPSVAVCAYTRRAAANSAKAILKDPILREQLTGNIMTIHALLEYIPETYYDVVDDKEKFRFAPTKTAKNPLSITTLIIEEATLVGLDLWEYLYDALPYDVQIIFVGDINQLPPVFGPSILNYALTKLPVVELKEVYRQAEGSPIINNAHRILKGEKLVDGSNAQGKFQLITGKQDTKIGQAKTAAALANMFKQFYDNDLYNPEEDMILSPWNKQELGTDAINTIISEFLSIKHQKLVYEVIAGFHKLYLAEGDKVIINKRDALIVSIERNPAYVGKEPAMAGHDLSRYGVRRMSAENAHLLDELSLDDEIDSIDYSNFSLEDMEETAMERKMQASHKVMVAYDDGYTDTITAAGDLAPSVFQLGYAMTVHKSQGSEWRRVFIIFHPDHLISLNREMLYTAITRAREEVYLIAKRYVVDKAVDVQKVKGNTLEDKIALFNSGYKEMNLGSIRVTKPSLGVRD